MYIFFRYSLLGENVERFIVDGDSGAITTTVPLDREEVAVYYLTLVAQDCSITEPRATAVNLTITVTDENDNAPQFPNTRYTIHIPDHTQPGKICFIILFFFYYKICSYIICELQACKKFCKQSSL